MPIREWARTHVRFHRSGASTDRTQRRQRRTSGTSSVRRARRPPCWRLELPRRYPRTCRFPRVPNLSLRRIRRRRWDHRGFRASPRCTDTHGTLLMDRNRSCAPAAPADPDSATGRVSAWKLIQALADVADAAGDVDAYCAAQQRLGPRVRNDAGIACRLIEASRAAVAYAIIQRAEPNRAKRVFRRACITGSPSAQITAVLE